MWPCWDFRRNALRDEKRIPRPAKSAGIRDDTPKEAFVDRRFLRVLGRI